MLQTAAERQNVKVIEHQVQITHKCNGDTDVVAELSHVSYVSGYLRFDVLEFHSRSVFRPK